MINLMNVEQKRDIRAARTNVLLLEYSAMLLVLAVTTAIIYGIGFWLVAQEKQAVTEKLESQGAQSASYKQIEARADTFRKNLAIAKQILDKETSYSSFLTTLAKDIPRGAILTNFSIGGQNGTVKNQKGMTLDARTNSYETMLLMKQKLEESPLFENVNIVDVNRPEDISKLTGLEGKYPYEASFNVMLSNQRAPTGSKTP